MVSPGTAMLAGAGLDFAGGLLSKSGGGKAARQQLHHQLFLDDKARAFNERWNQRQETMQRERFQIAAKDARAAGLHPLFALGAAGASSGFMAGQSPSGSAAISAVEGSPLGRATSNLGRGLQRWGANQARAQTELDTRLKQLQVDTAEFELNQMKADAASRAASNALGNGARRTELPDMGAEFERGKAGNTQVPYRLPTGEVVKILDPERFDEISQGDLLWEFAKMYGRQWKRNLTDWVSGSNTGEKYRRAAKEPLRIIIRKARGGER